MAGLYDRLKAKEASDTRGAPAAHSPTILPTRPPGTNVQPDLRPRPAAAAEAAPYQPVCGTRSDPARTAPSASLPPRRSAQTPPPPPARAAALLPARPPAAPPTPPSAPVVPPPRPPARVHIEAVLRGRVQERLAEQVEAGNLTGHGSTDGQRRALLARIEAILAEDGTIPPLERDAAARTLFNDLMGFGSIQDLLDDESVSEIMVNSPSQVYVERAGRLEMTGITFADNAQVMQLIDRIVAPLGRRIDESSPMVDARLPDGSRVNAIIAPLALKGPSVTIRKFAKKPISVADLVRFGTLNPAMAEFLQACVAARLNVVVSGGTGSGKTTTLNVLSSFIPSDERIVTIEDAAELQLRQDHVVSLETRPPNVEGKGEISIRHLVKNSLRMRPDRIVVGECRGGEALDMLQAMNTGHDGSLTTAHANSPRDLISRLETMVLMAGMDLPLRAIREQIASALDLVVQCSRLKDGTRRITHITEVQGMEGDVVVLQDIFALRQDGMTPDGKMIVRHVPTGIRPMFMGKLASAGVQVSLETFFDGGDLL